MAESGQKSTAGPVVFGIPHDNFNMPASAVSQNTRSVALTLKGCIKEVFSIARSHSANR